jgi:hypothetical protein
LLEKLCIVFYGLTVEVWWLYSFWFCCLYREEHGHHDHESYYGERDTDSLVAFMTGLVPPPVVDGRYAIEDKSGGTDPTNSTIKRPAPRSGGCRIEGFVKVKKVQNNYSAKGKL